MARNKKERALNREAQAHVDDPALLREQLREAIAAEQDGTSNPALRMRRKALQAAYEEAIRKQVVRREREDGSCQRTDVSGDE